jgi:quinol monooxygenase YgiN
VEEIIVVAKGRAKPGKEAELEAAFREAVRGTHGEPGCLLYAFHLGAEDKSLMVMIEKWTSKAELDKHFQTPHIKTLFGKIPNLAAAEPEVLVLNAVPEGIPEKGTI